MKEKQKLIRIILKTSIVILPLVIVSAIIQGFLMGAIKSGKDFFHFF